MPWLLVSPGHQQQCYWICRMNESLSYTITVWLTSAVFKIRSETCRTVAQFFQNLYMIKKESLPDRPKFCRSGSAVRHLFWRLHLQSQCWEFIENANIFSLFPKINSAWQGLIILEISLCWLIVYIVMFHKCMWCAFHRCMADSAIVLKCGF